MPRTTLSVPDALYERLEACKRDDESWPDVLKRAAEALESTDDGSERTMDALTQDHIDDIARATADEVENRMTRR